MTLDVKDRLKIYGSAGTFLCLWVRRLCAEAWLVLWHVPCPDRQHRSAPCSSAQIPKHDPPCRPQVHAECPKVLLLVVSPACCLGKSCRTFCLQRQPRDAFCSSKTRRALSSTYNMLVFLPCLVCLHVRNVHFDKEMINKNHVSCKSVVFRGDLNSVGAFPLGYSEYQP